MQRAAKAARVHTLTDPLGAKGFRATGNRVRTETSARRKVLLASVATFAASLGIIVGTNHLPTNAGTAATAPPTAAASNAQTSTSEGSALGAAVNQFTGQSLNGLTGTTVAQPTATATAVTHREVDGEENVASSSGDDSNENSAAIATQPSTSSSNSSQAVTSFQPTQAPFFQQPSHTQTGGS